MKIGGQYTGILMGEGTKLEMSYVKVRFLKIIADVVDGVGSPAILNISFLKVEGGEVGVKVKAEGAWKLEDCCITDSKVC